MKRETVANAPDKPIDVNDEDFVMRCKNVIIDCWAP